MMLNIWTDVGPDHHSRRRSRFPRYVLPMYLRIVKYKTAYYSFYLPVACALLLAGETNVAKFEAAKEVLVQMGTYFQVQDDFLDCYGAPEVIRKVGTDIEDTKCSWLNIQRVFQAGAFNGETGLLLEGFVRQEHPNRTSRSPAAALTLGLEAKQKP